MWHLKIITRALILLAIVSCGDRSRLDESSAVAEVESTDEILKRAVALKVGYTVNDQLLYFEIREEISNVFPLLTIIEDMLFGHAVFAPMGTVEFVLANGRKI